MLVFCLYAGIILNPFLQTILKLFIKSDIQFTQLFFILFRELKCDTLIVEIYIITTVATGTLMFI